MSRKEVNSVAYDAAHIIQTEADLEAKTATVKNVVTGEEYTGGGGGGDFSTAMVKDFSLSSGVRLADLSELCYIVNTPGGDIITSVPRAYVLSPGEPEYKIVLYKGVAETFLEAETADAYNITVTGDISCEYSEDDAAFIILIHGDGTILIETEGQ